MSASRVRLLVAGVATGALAVVAAACGADGTRSAADRGEAIYGANCAQCHGADLAGTERGPSLLEPVYLRGELTDAAVADAIRNGVAERRWDFGPMPANGALSDSQIDAVVEFLRAEQEAVGVSP
jgi:mono/diheme cytochrome c family protein